MVSARVSQKPFLEIPAEVYESLRLKEGDFIQIAIVPQTHTKAKELTREEKLALIDATQGIWADDEKIKEAFEYLERKWAEWKPTQF